MRPVIAGLENEGFRDNRPGSLGSVAADTNGTARVLQPGRCGDICVAEPWSLRGRRLGRGAAGSAGGAGGLFGRADPRGGPARCQMSLRWQVQRVFPLAATVASQTWYCSGKSRYWSAVPSAGGAKSPWAVVRIFPLGV